MNELAWLTPCLYVYERYFPVEWTEREIFWTSSVKPSNHQWALTARQHMFRDIHKGLMMACHRELTPTNLVLAHVSLADACDTSMSILMRFTHRLVLLFPPLLTSTGKAGREKQQQTLPARRRDRDREILINMYETLCLSFLLEVSTVVFLELVM